MFDSATALLSSMRADIFLMQPMTTASFRPETMPRARASQALALPEAQAAVLRAQVRLEAVDATSGASA